MKAVIEFFYGVGFSGMLLQIVPGIPDYISYSMIVFGLSTAIVAQWRQAIKDRAEHRKDIKEIKDDFKVTLQAHVDVMDKNSEIQREVLSKLNSFRQQYDSDKN